MDSDICGSRSLFTQAALHTAEGRLHMMKHKVTLADGRTVPALGLGTWRLGDRRDRRGMEIEALRRGIDAGMTVIDTAELYGNGRSELLVGEAVRGMDHSGLYLISKVLPENAGRKRMERSLDGSLSRLGTDYLDLYLYHWRGSIPLRETVECLEDLKKKGKIRAWGVSNFDIDEMEELFALPGGDSCLVNQVLYHIGSRGIEFSLKPWMEEHHVTLMAYCPLAQAGKLRRGLYENPVLNAVAAKHECDVSQVLLAWSIRGGKTIAIPGSSSAEHTLMNAAADRVELDAEDYAAIDRVYPKPDRKTWLDME